MRFVKPLGLVLVVACAVCAIAASSASASPTFLAHLWTNILLLAEAKSTQRFFTPGAGLTVTCTKVKLSPPDTPPALQALSILVTVNYTGCEVIGLAATVHPVRYRIDANGLVTLENNVLILALGCNITIPAAKNQSLTTVLFHNLPDWSILLLSHVTGITSSGTGVSCTYAEESNGTYTGNVRVFPDGPPNSTLRWDP
jgi:hypothetical protein